MTIDTLGKSDGIQNLKITNLHGHLLFDSSVDPALLAGVDDADDEDTSLAGVHDEDTSLTGVPVPNTTIMINAGDDSDAESNHNSVDPNQADDNSSKASVHSTRSHILVHSTTSEPPQHLRMRKSWTTQNYLSWKPMFPYYVNPKELLSHHLTTYLGGDARHMSQMYNPKPVKTKTKV